VCRPKHAEQLRNNGIINSTTRLHLVGSFYEIYITMHRPMNIKSESEITFPLYRLYSSQALLPTTEVGTVQKVMCVCVCVCVCVRVPTF
jgi:hypothetical protein